MECSDQNLCEPFVKAAGMADGGRSFNVKARDDTQITGAQQHGQWSSRQQW